MQEEFNLLMDEFYKPLQPAPLLQAGWQQLTVEAQLRGAAAPGAAPAFTDDRASDLKLMTSALRSYATSLPTVPASFRPGDAVAHGMALSVNETHTAYLDPSLYSQETQWESGNATYVGIGITLGGNPPVVEGVQDGTPAASAGLQQGDRFLYVDGHPTSDATLVQLSRLLGGPAGSSVMVTVQGSDGSAPRTYTMQRVAIPLQFVQSVLLDGTVGYVSLRGFPDSAIVDQMDQAVANLKAQGAQALIVDLRNNPGGSLAVGMSLLSRVVPPGTPAYRFVDRNGQSSTQRTPPGTPYDLPLAVLVGQGTASMAELYAAAVQENQAGIVVGQQTPGYVAGAEIYSLADGSGVEITEVDIRSGGGTVLNGVGVTPDDVVAVPDDASGTSDPTVDAAVQALEQQLATPDDSASADLSSFVPAA